MPKLKNVTEKDMFGHPLRKRVDKYERMLAKSDKETFASRVERLKFVDGIIGNIGMLGSMEAVFIFREAGWAYINGAFISNKLKDAEKLVLGSMKNYIYAENKEISKQAIEFLNNVAKKYPDIILKLSKELFLVFKSL